MDINALILELEKLKVKHGGKVKVKCSGSSLGEPRFATFGEVRHVQFLAGYGYVAINNGEE